MKTIVLLAVAVIAGAVRQPGEGPITVQDEQADLLVEAGQASFLDEMEDVGLGDVSSQLSSMSVAELKTLAAEKAIDLGDAAKKAEIIALIEAQSPAA